MRSGQSLARTSSLRCADLLHVTPERRNFVPSKERQETAAFSLQKPLKNK